MPVFVDSNVIVYARDLRDPSKQAMAKGWMDSLWHSGTGRLSTQVLQEAYAVLTAKLGVSRPTARADIADLFAWKPFVVGPETVQSAWLIQDECSVSFWDSLIVAAAAASGCEELLTEDLAHGQAYAGVRVVDPFVSPPSI